MKTLETVPIQAPSALRVAPHEATSALVRWTALAREEWNADRVGYRLVYRVYRPAAQPTVAPLNTAENASSSTSASAESGVEEVPMSEEQPASAGIAKKNYTNEASAFYEDSALKY